MRDATGPFPAGSNSEEALDSEIAVEFDQRLGNLLGVPEDDLLLTSDLLEGGTGSLARLPPPRLNRGHPADRLSENGCRCRLVGRQVDVAHQRNTSELATRPGKRLLVCEQRLPDERDAVSRAWQPMVAAERRNAAHRVDGVGSDQDRRTVRVRSCDADVRIVEPVVLAVERTEAAAPEEPHRRDRLGESLLPTRVGDPRGLGLVAPIALGDAENEAAGRERIERGNDLGHLDGVVIGKDDDGRRHRQGWVARQNRGGERDGLEELRQRPREVVVAHADVVEAGLGRPLSEPQLEGDRILRRHLLPRWEKRAENQSELHRLPLDSPPIRSGGTWQLVCYIPVRAVQPACSYERC